MRKEFSTMRNLPKYTQVCGPIRELLGLKSTEEFTVILWTSLEEVPEEGASCCSSCWTRTGAVSFARAELMRTDGI